MAFGTYIPQPNNQVSNPGGSSNGGHFGVYNPNPSQPTPVQQAPIQAPHTPTPLVNAQSVTNTLGQFKNAPLPPAPKQTFWQSLLSRGKNDYNAVDNYLNNQESFIGNHPIQAAKNVATNLSNPSTYKVAGNSLVGGVGTAVNQVGNLINRGSNFMDRTLLTPDELKGSTPLSTNQTNKITTNAQNAAKKEATTPFLKNVSKVGDVVGQNLPLILTPETKIGSGLEGLGGFLVKTAARGGENATLMAGLQAGSGESFKDIVKSAPANFTVGMLFHALPEGASMATNHVADSIFNKEVSKLTDAEANSILKVMTENEVKKPIETNVPSSIDLVKTSNKPNVVTDISKEKGISTNEMDNPVSLHNGSNNKVTTVEKKYGNVLEVDGSQRQLAKVLEDKGVQVPSAPGQNYKQLDPFLHDWAKENGFDAIKYNNKGITGAKPFDEYHDIKENKFYTDNKGIAQINSTKRGISLPTEGIKPSKVGQSIESKAVEKKLTDGFGGTAGYDPIEVKAQAKMGADLFNTDAERGKRIISGEEAVPKDMRGATIITSGEEYALKNNDAQMLKDIANSPLTAETSKHAQELRLLAERNPGSPTKLIRDANKRLEDTLPVKKIAKEAKVHTEDMAKEIKKVKVTKTHWDKFLEDIKC